MSKHSFYYSKYYEQKNGYIWYFLNNVLFPFLNDTIREFSEKSRVW